MNYQYTLFILLFNFGCAVGTSQPTKDIDTQANHEAPVYKNAHNKFIKKNYDKSLELFTRYIEDNKERTTKESKKRVFWAIDQIGKIYLRIKKKPKDAIKFFESILKTVNLTEDEEEDVNEWLSAAKEWDKLGKMPENVKNPKELFRLGEKYFSQGMEKINYPMDDAGNADFHIAATYLIPYVFNYDGEKNVGKALFMLGNIRFRSWNDYGYWTENFYLKEVIRRYPHSKLAERAYKVLENGVRTSYTGSGGESTPKAILDRLKNLKKLATRKK